ncbi:alpha-2,8-polysialyltransferase family protein [Marinobacter pelagius]|uniref:alpha-2,8-polysialyltransferase family protein n=1 Tax=Marinobacter sp. C7 TaxID=2951363 RepID=UPI001EF0AE20|nr:alpha-2,8-polysialyltransferase family protein [Marinobacter sp. C7]MCG7201368.1 alpha-2,8-polysialyltransferase family protein [Marinobacter sp. C7]
MTLNVFVASTPLQLISCAEARGHYRCPDESCLLVIARPDNRVTETQVAFLLEQLGLQGVQTIYLRKSTFYLRLSSVFRQLSGRQIDRLFIGNQSSWIHEVFYLGLSWKQLVFVDDGLATVKYYHAIHSEGLASRVTADKRRLLGRLGIHLHRVVPDRVSFFTCFPLESSDKVDVATHDFPVFRQTFQPEHEGRQGAPLVGFIGQPFGGEDRLTQMQSQVRHVVERHPGAKIVYFMHRKERRRELKQALLGLPIELRSSPRWPIEVEVALSREPYVAFYSFTSTALFTLKKIFPELPVYQIDDAILAAKLPFYDEIQSMFRGIGVETTRL